MKQLRFDAPSHYVLREGGEEVHGGQVFEVDNDRAEELLTQPGLDVSEVEADDGSDESEAVESHVAGDWTRGQLNELAREVGVSDPEDLPNKAAVEAAIEAKEAEPEAEDGEGHTYDTEED